MPIVDHGPYDCSGGFSPASPLLTDFTDATWNNTLGKWGCGFNGALYSYNNPATTTAPIVAASTIMQKVDNMGHFFQLYGDVASGGYAGGGMSFGQCVDTTVYTGVQFELNGTTAGCDLYFQVQTYDAQGVENHGGCPTGGVGCYIFPSKMLSTTLGGMVTVHFSELTGGMPAGATAIASQIVGLQWQLQSPPPPPSGLQVSCGNVALNITNVSFVTQ